MIIIVSGASATGKTYLAERIAKSKSMPLISKDKIKEELFESETRTTHDFYWYEKRSKQIFYQRINQAIKADHSFVIEGDLIASDKKRLHSMLVEPDKVFEFYCWANSLTRIKRFIARNESGNRHKGHRDRRWYPLIVVIAFINSFGLDWPYGPVNIDGHYIKLDLSNIDNQATDKIISQSLNK